MRRGSRSHSRKSSLAALALCTLPLTAKEGRLDAPNADALPINQLVVSGNACGPAALLCSFRFASEDWQGLETMLPGDNDRSRVSYLIRRYGMRPSNHLSRPRWNPRSGVNLLDLADIGNELRGARGLPKLEWQIMLQRDRESGARLMKRCHAQFAKSLKQGLPPIVGLQRLSQRPVAGVSAWITIHGHFVVMTGMPKTLERGAKWMPFQYADPWGGQMRLGVLKVDESQGFPALVADMPYSRFGQDKLKKGEKSIVIVSSSLGAF